MKSDTRLTLERYLVEVVVRGQEPTHLVTAVRLPSGAVEIAINTEQLGEKLHYIARSYDDEMRLKTNQSVRMIELMAIFPEVEQND